MAGQTRKTGGFGFVAMFLLAVFAIVAAASFLLPTTVGRLVADLWVGVMTSIGQMLGG